MEFNLEVVLYARCCTLIFSGKGNTLKELNAFDTLVSVMTKECVFPTVKSLKVIYPGLAINADFPLNPACFLV